MTLTKAYRVEVMKSEARAAALLSGRSPAIKRREHRSQKSFQQRGFRPATCEYPNAEQDRQQEACKVFSRLRGRDLAGLLPCAHAAAEIGFQFHQHARHDLLELRIMRRHFQRRIHQQAALAILVSERAVDDLIEERLERLERRQRAVETPDTVVHALRHVVSQGLS